MRVLVLPLVFPSARQPNPGIFVLHQMQALRELGHECEVLRVVPYAPPIGAKWRAYCEIPPREEIDGFSVRTIRAVVPPRNIGMEYLPFEVHVAVRREIERFRPDIVHAHFLISSGHIAVRHPVPTVVTAHGGDAYRWPFERPGLLRAARETIFKATRLTAVSAFIDRSIQRIAQRPAEVIWNGGDEFTFFPRDSAECRARLQLPQDRSIVAFAGTVCRAKGLFDLVAALARIDKPLRPILLVVGSGPDAAALLAQSKDAGVELRLVGQRDSAGVAEHFGAADAVVLPSHDEGLPVVVCEAMLSQRAVVATTVGGIPEIIRDGTTGLLVAPRASAELASALTRVLGDDTLRARLGDAARRFAAKRLTWRVNAQRYRDIYRDALAAFDTSSTTRA
ncbi:MAG: glycosyltransferase [Candidatus Aquilonibacter sp.]